MKRKIAGYAYFPFIMAALFLAVSCGGPKLTYTAKVGAMTYPPVNSADVAIFESTPQKGSYIELGEISIEDELKCDMGKAFVEEKALKILEELKKENPDMGELTDITMLELLAEKGKIERGNICILVARFSRKEEKTNFITIALQGSNLKTLSGKAGKIGANALMKLKHHDWKIRQKPSSFGADATQTASLKVGVKTTAVTIHYEGPEGEPPLKDEKVLVVVKNKAIEKDAEEKKEKEEKKAPPKAAEKKKEKGKTKVKAAAAAKKKEKKTDKASAKKAEKKPAMLKSAILADEARKKQEKLDAAESGIKLKLKEAKKLKTAITEDKEKVKALKKIIVKLKMKAAKAKLEEEKNKKEKEKKATALTKKMNEEKKKEEVKKAKADLATSKAKEKEKVGKKEEEEADVSEAVKEAKTKIKAGKSKIFDCLHESKIEGAIKVTYLFKPSGEIDALGFAPDAPEVTHKCIMQVLKKEKFPEAARYYKAIFKYKIK